MAIIRLLLVMLALSIAVVNVQVPEGNTWQKYIVGPQSRTVQPAKILSTAGNVTNPSGLLPGGIDQQCLLDCSQPIESQWLASRGHRPAVFTRLQPADGNPPPDSPTVMIDFGLNFAYRKGDEQLSLRMAKQLVLIEREGAAREQGMSSSWPELLRNEWVQGLGFGGFSYQFAVHRNKCYDFETLTNNFARLQARLALPLASKSSFPPPPWK